MIKKSFAVLLIGTIATIFFISCRQTTPVEAQEPVITFISDDTTTIPNTAVKLLVTAEVSDGGALSYQWYSAKDKLADGTIIEEADGADFSPDVTQSGSLYYYCQITNTLKKSSKTVQSPRILVTVLPGVEAKAPVIVIQPVNFSGQIDDVFSFTVVAVSKDDGTLSYQWYFASTEDGAYTAVGEGENTFSGKLALTNLGYYYCTITNTIEDNGDGSPKTASVTTNKVILSDNVVNANKPVITTQPQGGSAILPAEYTFTVGAYSPDSGTLSYQWYSITEAATESEGGTAVSGATEESYTVSSSEKSKIGYYCVITNTIKDNGDGGIKSASVTSQAAWFETVDFTETLTTLVISEQPCSMTVVPYNHTTTLTFKVEFESGYQYPISYQWYQSADGTTDWSPVTEGEGCTSEEYTTAVFTERGIKYFYCEASTKITAYDGTVTTLTSTSNVASVAYTGLPLLVIETVNGEEPTADYVSPPAGCYGSGLRNATKPKAQMWIFKDGIEDAVYDSGEYNKELKTGLTIKLRGNTSAYGEKKPYKIKLQNKVDLLADFLPNRTENHKDKEWILLKDGTTLNTFVGMAVADILGTPWTPEFTFVNVVINNDYRGIYLLIEAINKSETRINIADDGFIIERDAYWWNEEVKFITSLYNQKYTFKYPDDEDITSEQIAYIENYMNTLEQNVQAGTYEDYLDVESFARWLLIHDILGTWDSAGSNIYMTKYDSSDSKIFMSTTWDYDTNYRMKDSWAAQYYGIRIYADPMMLSLNSTFKDSYKNQWENISSALWNDLSKMLEELNISQGEDINLSRKIDSIRWNKTAGTVSYNIQKARNWFVSRVDWLNTAINEL